MDKTQLRKDMKHKRSLLTETERRDFSEQAARRLMSLKIMLNAQSIGLFSSVGEEIDTAVLYDYLSESGRQVFFPRMDKASRSLNWGHVETLKTMVQGPYGIFEPELATDCTAQLDLIVVPGLGFGLNGGRLGYGAGWYDRTLKHFKGPVVGLGYDCQVLESVPTEAHDRPVHWIVTELRAIPLGD
jgi:5-formyltetrahydrofolate cyclo-ligase